MCSVGKMHKGIRQRLLFPTGKYSLKISSGPTVEACQALIGFPKLHEIIFLCHYSGYVQWVRSLGGLKCENENFKADRADALWTFRY